MHKRGRQKDVGAASLSGSAIERHEGHHSSVARRCHTAQWWLITKFSSQIMRHMRAPSWPRQWFSFFFFPPRFCYATRVRIRSLCASPYSPVPRKWQNSDFGHGRSRRGTNLFSSLKRKTKNKMKSPSIYAKHYRFHLGRWLPILKQRTEANISSALSASPSPATTRGRLLKNDFSWACHRLVPQLFISSVNH